MAAILCAHISGQQHTRWWQTTQSFGGAAARVDAGLVGKRIANTKNNRQQKRMRRLYKKWNLLGL
jgi:hypothetical protein